MQGHRACSHPAQGDGPLALGGGVPVTPPPYLQENMRRVDVQLLAQLCRLGLEMGALWEELTANVEEEEEEESGEEEEEDKEPQEKQGQGHQGPSWVDLRTPDFEMII